MRKKWLKIGTVQLMLIIASVILGMIFFIQIEVDSDMSASMVGLYKQEMYLGEGFQWTNLQSYTPWDIARWISYRIFGMSEDGVKFVVTIFFTLCSLITFELAIDNYESDSLTAIPVLFFMLIPGIATNKYHYTSTIVTLITLLYIKKRGHIPLKARRVTDVLAGVLFIALFLLTVDKMLIILNVLGPVLLYHLYKNVKEKRNLGIIYLGGACVILLVFVWYLYSLGHPGEEVSLYGAGSYYLRWADFSESWRVGIEFLIKTVIRAMNCSTTGVIVQPMTLVWIVKMLLIVGSGVILIGQTRKVVQHTKEGSDNIYWALVCGAVILSVLFYLVNGVRIELYDTYGYSYSYCGYMGVVWLLIPLMSAEYVRTCIRKVERHMRLLITCIWVGCGMLCAMQARESTAVLIDGYQNINKQTADYLTSIGAEGAFAAYEASYPVTVWSEGKVYSVGNADSDEESKWAYRRFDTYIEWKTNNKGLDTNEQNSDRALLDTYGMWVEKQKFREDATRTYQSDYPQERFVYFYNRDIRWNTKEIDISLLNTGANRVYMPLGQNRVQLNGSGLADVELQFLGENGKLLECEKEYISDAQISYLVMCPYNGDVEVCISDTDGEGVILERLYWDMNRAAVCAGQGICIAENESIDIRTELPTGEYVFILNGEDLRGINLTSVDESVEIEVYQNGKGRKICFCTVKEDCPSIKVTNVGRESVDIENIYYELTYEERIALIEKLNGEK